ncbi:hypothetical protein O181_116223 [Austropuccinia psidii MF-1]|uniref:Uncharacterized protein n=1 Tax=Austropuccinia psidii MF-1 TaxID=1389203 RepID=A0A9Q3K7X6_9BASI|nr:hypothetical protein [Austropuccinia psidii MF-1]
MWTRSWQDQIQKCQIFLKKDTYGGFQSFPHSPRSLPTNFDVNSESGLIHDNILRSEPLSSFRNRNLTMPIQKLVQSSQRRGVGNMPKTLAGGHELLLIHQKLSGSGEYHRALRRLEPIVLQRQIQEDKELVEEPNSFIHGPEEGTGNDPSFGDRRPSGIYQIQKCPKTSPKYLRRSRKVPRTIKERAKENPIGTDLTHKGTGFPNLEPSAMDSVFNMARTLMEFTSKEQETMNRTFPWK